MKNATTQDFQKLFADGGDYFLIGIFNRYVNIRISDKTLGIIESGLKVFEYEPSIKPIEIWKFEYFKDGKSFWTGKPKKISENKSAYCLIFNRKLTNEERNLWRFWAIGTYSQ